MEIKAKVKYAFDGGRELQSDILAVVGIIVMKIVQL